MQETNTLHVPGTGPHPGAHPRCCSKDWCQPDPNDTSVGISGWWIVLWLSRSLITPIAQEHAQWIILIAIAPPSGSKRTNHTSMILTKNSYVNVCRCASMPAPFRPKRTRAAYVHGTVNALQLMREPHHCLFRTSAVGSALPRTQTSSSYVMYLFSYLFSCWFSCLFILCICLFVYVSNSILIVHLFFCDLVDSPFIYWVDQYVIAWLD